MLRRAGASSAAIHLGAQRSAEVPINPRFSLKDSSGGFSPMVGTAMPSLTATRRAVSSRCAVMLRTDRRASFKMAAGAVSGVPLSKGGSRAQNM